MLCSPSPIQLIFHSLLQHVNLENIKWNRNKIILRRPLAYTPCDEAAIPTSGRFAIHGGSHTSFWTHVSFDSVYMLICLCRRINTSGSNKDPTKRVSVSTRWFDCGLKATGRRSDLVFSVPSAVDDNACPALFTFSWFVLVCFLLSCFFVSVFAVCVT